MLPDQNAKPTIRLELTPKQTEQVRQAIGRDLLEIELNVEELEARIAPTGGRLASNHNEPLLADD